MTKLKSNFILFTIVLVFLTSFNSVSVSAAGTKDIMFGKVKVEVGMIGKISISKETSIQRKDKNGKVVTVQKATKGQEYGIFSKGKGLYQLGQGKFIKHSSAVKYSAIPKSILDKVAKQKAPSKTKPVEGSTKKETKKEKVPTKTEQTTPAIDVSKLNPIEKEYYEFGTKHADQYGLKLTDLGYSDFNGGKIGRMTFYSQSDNKMLMYWVKGFQGTTQDGIEIQKDTYFVATKLLTKETEIDGLVSLATYKTGEINQETLKDHLVKVFTDDSYTAKYVDAGWEISVYKNVKSKSYEISIIVPWENLR